MSKRELTLAMTFKTAGGTNTNVSIKGVKENLSKEEIVAVMNDIIAKKPFYSAGGDLLAKVKAEIADKTTSTMDVA